MRKKIRFYDLSLMPYSGGKYLHANKNDNMKIWNKYLVTYRVEKALYTHIKYSKNK